jgi:Ras-related protein Rab-19
MEHTQRNLENILSVIPADIIKEERTTELNINCMFKVIIVGDSEVGKSCLMKMLTKGEFKNEYEATMMGVEYGDLIMGIDKKDVIKLQIWELPGKELFRSTTNNFLNNV